ENPDACYECGRTGHIKKYCPQLRNKTASSNSRDFKEKKFKSRKALLTWDDSDESDKEGSEDEDVAQLCFMANDDDPKSKYTRELLKRFGLDNAKPRGTPISPSVNLIKDENGKDVDSKLFREKKKKHNFASTWASGSLRWGGLGGFVFGMREEGERGIASCNLPVS
ncbi:hypothetical protein RJ640_013173, partial [Escallonia rubra]